MYRLLIFLMSILLIISIKFQPIDINSYSKNFIKIEVKGAIENPGFYTLEKGSTFNDLLIKLKINEDADLSSFNKQLLLSDKDVINIPVVTSVKLISINSATLQELITLPGIGETTANRIIEYRSLNLFKSIEELKNVKGIGDAKYEALCHLICL